MGFLPCTKHKENSQLDLLRLKDKEKILKFLEETEEYFYDFYRNKGSVMRLGNKGSIKRKVLK